MTISWFLYSVYVYINIIYLHNIYNMSALNPSNEWLKPTENFTWEISYPINTTLHFKFDNQNQKERLLRHLSRLNKIKKRVNDLREKTWMNLKLTFKDLIFDDQQEKEFFFNWLANIPQLKEVINEFPTSIQLDLIAENPELYKWVNNPSKEFTLKAIKRNFRVIDYIDYPSDDLQVAALMQSKEAVNAVIHNGYKDYKLGPKASQLVEIWSSWWNINNIKNPCEEAIELDKRIKNKKVKTIQHKKREEEQTIREYERARQKTIKEYQRLRRRTIKELERIEAKIASLKNYKEKESE